MIPIDWRFEELSVCLERLIDYRGKSTPKSSSGIPLITARNVKEGFLNFSEQEYMSKQDYDSWMTRGLPQKGDLLFTTEAPLGNVALFPDDRKTYALAQRIVTLRPDQSVIETRYLMYYFLSDFGKREIKGRATGSTAIGIRQSELTRIRVLLPPLVEQRKIAGILSTWDRAIDLTSQLIAAKQRYKRGLVQQLLMGKRRFKQFVRSEEIQDTVIGPIPADWGYVSVGQIAHQVSERNAIGIDLPVLSSTKYEGLVDSLSYFGRQIFSEDTSTYKIVRRHQFAYATNHIEEGSIGYQNLYDDALISPMYTVFKTNSSVDDRFLYALLKTETYRQIFERSTSSSVNRRGSLRWNEFSHIKVPLPSIGEQRAIAEVLDTCDRQLALLNRKLELLKKQKKGLMQQLLTGKVRVKI
jgi:restriction endonuclease S subunit